MHLIVNVDKMLDVKLMFCEETTIIQLTNRIVRCVNFLINLFDYIIHFGVLLCNKTKQMLFGEKNLI